MTSSGTAPAIENSSKLKDNGNKGSPSAAPVPRAENTENVESNTSSRQELVREMCNDYAKYADHQHATTPFVDKIQKETLEQLLMRLDEFHTLLQTLVSERDQSKDLVKQLVECGTALQRRLAVIDAVETFVLRLEQTFAEIERRVGAAQREAKTIALKNVLSSRRKANALVHGFSPLKSGELQQVLPSSQSVVEFLKRLANELSACSGGTSTTSTSGVQHNDASNEPNISE